jgi:hypothetical protein
MTQDDGGYDFASKPEQPQDAAPPASPTPPGEPSAAAAGPPKPGEPGWVPPVPVVEAPDPEDAEAIDVEKHKGMAILGYIFFMIPLIAAPNSKFARFHANQGLLLFILLMVIVFAVIILSLLLLLSNRFLAEIGILKFFFGCGFNLLQIAMLVTWVGLTIYGIINAANGIKKELPGIGHWTLIK